MYWGFKTFIFHGFGVQGKDPQTGKKKVSPISPFPPWPTFLCIGLSLQGGSMNGTPIEFGVLILSQEFASCRWDANCLKPTSNTHAHTHTHTHTLEKPQRARYKTSVRLIRWCPFHYLLVFKNKKKPRRKTSQKTRGVFWYFPIFGITGNQNLGSGLGKLVDLWWVQLFSVQQRIVSCYLHRFYVFLL